MGNWDNDTPLATDKINLWPAASVRLLTALEEALQAEGIFPGSAPTTAPKFQWQVRFVTTTERNALTPYDRQLIINTTTKQFERYDLGTTSWVAVDAIPDGGISATKLAAAVAGAGLSGGGGTALSVNVDNSTIECPVDTLQVKDAGITAAKLAAAVAGDGLTNNGTGLVVNVDNSTIETNSDALRVKDAGITEPKLATAVVNKLGQNIGLTTRAHVTVGTGDTAYTDVVNFTGQGRLMGIGVNALYGDTSVRITIDGTAQVLVASMAGWDSVVFEDSDSDNFFKLSGSAGNLTELGVFFKTSLRVEIKVNADSGPGNESEIRVQYERQA